MSATVSTDDIQEKPEPWWMEDRMRGGGKPDASTHFHGGNIDLRRRRDGYTRVEVHVYNGRIRYNGETPWFVWYLTDDERSEIAATFDPDRPKETK